MSTDVTMPSIADVVGYLRAYLSRRDFCAREALLHKFDGHYMLKLLVGIESQSVDLMQQRVAQVLAALELGYLCDGPSLLPQSPAVVGWSPPETISLVGHLPGMLMKVHRSRELLKPPKP
jgi:hypothetical protein